MSGTIPAQRVHLVMAGLPQQHARPLALDICAALHFAAQNHPAFTRFITDGLETGDPAITAMLSDLTPQFLALIADMVTAGIAADENGDGQ